MRFGNRILLLILMAAPVAYGKSKTIQHKIVKLKRAPNLFAPIVGELSYLEEVKVTEEQKGWSKVESLKNKKVVGWVQNAALSSQTALQIKNADKVELSKGAVTLAGKGFSSDHEKAMKQKDQKLDFARVDQVEKIEVSDPAFKNFVGGGGFKAAKGRGAP